MALTVRDRRKPPNRASRKGLFHFPCPKGYGHGNQCHQYTYHADNVDCGDARNFASKAQFCGLINREYDDSFAQSGAKIGQSLRIRVPNRYTIRSNTMTLSPEHGGELATLRVSNVSGVDMSFNTTDLTMSMDRFTERYIEPAAAIIAADIESKCIGVLTRCGTRSTARRRRKRSRTSHRAQDAAGQPRASNQSSGRSASTHSQMLTLSIA